MNGQRLRQLGVFRSDLAAEQFLQFAVLANQAVDPFLKPAAVGVEIVFEGGGEAVMNESGVLAQLGLQSEQHVIGLAADLFAVDLAPRLPQRQDADPQGA